MTTERWRYRTIEEVKRANRDAGWFFFSPDTMRWFGCRVSRRIYPYGIFVTSEADRHPENPAWNGRRYYSVRQIQDDATVETLGEFGDYLTSKAAHAAAQRLSDEFEVLALAVN